MWAYNIGVFTAVHFICRLCFLWCFNLCHCSVANCFNSHTQTFLLLRHNGSLKFLISWAAINKLLHNRLNCLANCIRRTAVSATSVDKTFCACQGNANDTLTRNRRQNRYQKTGSGFWRVWHAIWYQVFLVPFSANECIGHALFSCRFMVPVVWYVCHLYECVCLCAWFLVRVSWA